MCLTNLEAYLKLRHVTGVDGDREVGMQGICQSSKLQDKFIFLSLAIMSYGVTFAAPLHFMYLCTS
jgi:hypothetical protein